VTVAFIEWVWRVMHVLRDLCAGVLRAGLWALARSLSLSLCLFVSFLLSTYARVGLRWCSETCAPPRTQRAESPLSLSLDPFV
jgi:hypothetical protein